MKRLIDKCHQTYCEASGLDMRLEFDRERAWFEFIRAGFTEADLRLVIGQLMRGIRDGDRNPGCLRFRNLIERLDWFEEELAMAKAQARNFRAFASPKETVVRQWRPQVTETIATSTARPAKEVLAKAIDELRKAVA